MDDLKRCSRPPRWLSEHKPNHEVTGSVRRAQRQNSRSKLRKLLLHRRFPSRHHLLTEAWWWQHHAGRVFSAAQTERSRSWWRAKAHSERNTQEAFRDYSVQVGLDRSLTWTSPKDSRPEKGSTKSPRTTTLSFCGFTYRKRIRILQSRCAKSCQMSCN